MKYTLVETSDDEKDFGRKAADVFRQSLMKYADPYVALPTGKTPLPLYRQLVEDGAENLPSFSYGQIDEYLGLPAHHPKLFLEEMKVHLLGPLGIKISSSFNSAALSFDTPERDFDIAVLGIGRNGHVGFNEPGSDFNSVTRIVALSAKTIEDNKTDWNEALYGAFPTHAVTRGLGELRSAKSTILLVRGQAKAEILAQAFAGPQCEFVPASCLQAQPDLTIVADHSALSILRL